jgi:two-component system nitrogen regulation sensor histidine kinase NtrY
MLGNSQLKCVVERVFTLKATFIKDFNAHTQSSEANLAQLSLLASLPVLLLLVWVMNYAKISVYYIFLTILLVTVMIVYDYVKIQQISAFQFRSLSNLLDAMNQRNDSLRASSVNSDNARNVLVNAINNLAKSLNKPRLETIENQILLRTVIDHIDVAIIAVNDNYALILSNPAANTLLQLPTSSGTHNLSQTLCTFDSLVSGQSNEIDLCGIRQNIMFTLNYFVMQGNNKNDSLSLT